MKFKYNYLLSILPVGLVSKKLIGHFNILLRSELCILCEALQATVVRVIDDTKASKPLTHKTNCVSLEIRHVCIELKVGSKYLK